MISSLLIQSRVRMSKTQDSTATSADLSDASDTGLKDRYTVDTPYKNVLGTKENFLYSINSRIFLYGINFTLVLRFGD